MELYVWTVGVIGVAGSLVTPLHDARNIQSHTPQSPARHPGACDSEDCCLCHDSHVLGVGFECICALEYPEALLEMK